MPRSACPRPKMAGLAAAGGTAGKEGCSLLRAGLVLPRPPHRLCPRVVAKGGWGPSCTPACHPEEAVKKGAAGRWESVSAWTHPCTYIQLHGSASDPSLCHEPHSLSRPREAPAFLAKPGSSTHVGECGCDAASTGRLPPAAPGCLQLGPALLPEPAGTLEKQSRRKGRSCWLSRGREVRLCEDTHLLHYPSPRQRDRASVQQGEQGTKREEGRFCRGKRRFP